MTKFFAVLHGYPPVFCQWGISTPHSNPFFPTMCLFPSGAYFPANSSHISSATSTTSSGNPPVST
ncbi:hypothetical protein I4907_13125 [Proteus mirabilis]|uniref:hypothetical protein n=1 Tax=Proteus mirabilis TaxID=584 RepID=UPI0018C65E43|nr:hypothetical protein [Proteus mirabilis]MBG2971549.1 hypothetical protein [Proteus mirabilis]